MSLLELEHVAKSYGRGPYRQTVLREVTLDLELGEMVAVWGLRRSGRSTFLRVAGGIERPDDGAVRFDGRRLGERGCTALGSSIAYCRKAFLPSEGELVMDQLTVGQLARGVPPSPARNRARAALERAGAEACATRRPNELDGEERIRVAVARALALQPSVLLVDEPTIGADLLARDGILDMLRSLADEGMAILTTTGETSGLAGARPLTLSEGELHGETRREMAPVVPLRRSA